MERLPTTSSVPLTRVWTTNHDFPQHTTSPRATPAAEHRRAAATVWGLAAVTVLLLTGVWLDLLWEFSPEWRIGTFWVAGIAGAVLLAALATATVRAARNAAIARRLDRAGVGGGRILTGWELAQEEWTRGACLVYATGN